MATYPLSRLSTRRLVSSIIFVLCLYALTASLPSQFVLFPSYHPESTSDDSIDNLKPEHRCDAFSNSADILVVVKTGANEIYEKLPTQLLTALRCYDDLLIFSDLDQRIGSHHVYDALDNITEATKLDNADFDYYHTLQEYQRFGQDVSPLKEEAGKAAWVLDKYKFLHILVKTWNMRPGRKWYIFIEADTYLVRSNLMLWLERLDSSQPLYLGSPTSIRNGVGLKHEPFAHGGSGIILSRGAMSRFVEGDPGVAARYDEGTRHEGLGDFVLMKALHDKGIKFSKRWPMLQGEKPATIPFGTGPGGKGQWCQPVVTMHHVTPDEMSTIWRFEEQRLDIKVR